MKKIAYKIKFYSPWHCGSGLSAGADVDLLVIKDKNGMPYIPGKTLKGLIREAAESYAQYMAKREDLTVIFGNEGKTTGCAYFSNATLAHLEYDEIVKQKLQRFMYRKSTTTAIGDNGIAKDKSLRSIEVVVPCELHATIDNVPEEMEQILVKSLSLIKRMGHKRNRGLGRCDVKLEEEKGGSE